MEGGEVDVICGFDLSYNIGLREFGYSYHGTHDRDVTAHDADSRVLIVLC